MDPVWQIAPCGEDEALELAAGLGVHRTTAEVLIRRGLGEPEAARAPPNGGGAVAPSRRSRGYDFRFSARCRWPQGSRRIPTASC